MPQGTGYVRATCVSIVVKTCLQSLCQLHCIVSASILALARVRVGIHGVHLMPVHIKSTRAVMRNVAHRVVTAPV